VISWTNASSTATFTLTTATTATTAGLFFTLPMSPKPPEPEDLPALPSLRSGDVVRVTSEGLLQNRVGTVSGFMEVGGSRLAFVSWSEGGWTTFAESDLQRAGKPK